ncbi:MAG TPA: Hsp20/alpha crystallin family protein [Coleofasciculaceae cyanobacterium]
MTPLAIEHELTNTPAAEIEETPEAFLLKVELPGIDPKELEVDVTPESVSIAGERRSQKTVEDKGLFRSEFHYGKFQRVIPLPSPVQTTNSTAEYHDGILFLRLLKVEQESTKAVRLSIG